ncbi:MAG: hypothetical protein J6D08_14480 [Lachnospiraceae bacterium]|nr:hypothetical protein [Lachnospiraceae bacterium]
MTEQPIEPVFYPNESKILPKKEITIPVKIDTDKLDEAIVKAKELVALLQEANELTNSLSNNRN